MAMETASKRLPPSSKICQYANLINSNFELFQYVPNLCYSCFFMFFLDYSENVLIE